MNQPELLPASSPSGGLCAESHSNTIHDTDTFADDRLGTDASWPRADFDGSSDVKDACMLSITTITTITRGDEAVFDAR
jgi:hypothetical protein